MCKATMPRVQLPGLMWAAGQRQAPRLRHHFKDAGEKPVEIDACMADLVKQLNDNGYTTTSCCCGHYRTNGYIYLDNRVCLILPVDDSEITLVPEVPPYYSKFDVEHARCSTDGLTLEKLQPFLEKAYA